MNDHKERIKKLIKDSIRKFKNKEIDYNELIESISGNMSALDNISRELDSAKHRVCGKLDIIHYTVDTKKEFEAMLDEVRKFEEVIDKML